MNRRALALLLVLAANAAAQTLRVIVVADAGPVENAAVSAGGHSAATNAEGVALLPVAGPVQIRVRKEGYFPASADVPAGIGEIRVELREAETVEGEVTIYATRTDVRIQDSPVRVEVLQQEEIDEKTLMTPGDIVMMLNEMGGMRVQTTSPALGAASVRVQGMRGRYTRFLSDGLPLFGQQGAGLGLLQIPPMDLGQVEVIKGSASALYGAGAMAGVVNLIGRRPGPEPVREILLNRTSLAGTDASAFLASTFTPAWSASLLAGGHFQDRRDRDGDRWADLAGYRRGILRPRFFWNGGEGRSALLTGGALFEDRTGGTMEGAVLAATRAPYLESLGTHRYDAGGSGQWLFGGRYVAAARFSASTLRHDHGFGEVRERDRHDLLFGEASLRGAMGRHTWIVGAAAERDAYRPRDLTPFAYTFITPGVFVQEDADLAPWLSLSASARADFHNRYGTFFSPRLSGLLRGGGWTARLSAGQGFFAPTPLSEETEAAGLARLTIPRPLRPERGRTASFDLTRGVGPVTVTATLFGSTVRDPIYVDRGGIDRGGRYEIVNLPGPTRQRGAELLGVLRREPFYATLSYAYVASSEVEPAGSARSEVPLTPRHSFGFVGMWEREGKGRLGVECYYTGRQRLEFDPYRRFSRPYVIVGVLAERRVHRNLRLFVNLENLTNVRQTRWNPLLRPNRAADGRWTVDAWAPLDGRVINGGVRFNF